MHAVKINPCVTVRRVVVVKTAASSSTKKRTIDTYRAGQPNGHNDQHAEDDLSERPLKKRRSDEGDTQASPSKPRITTYSLPVARPPPPNPLLDNTPRRGPNYVICTSGKHPKKAKDSEPRPRTTAPRPRTTAPRPSSRPSTTVSRATAQKPVRRVYSSDASSPRASPLNSEDSRTYISESSSRSPPPRRVWSRPAPQAEEEERAATEKAMKDAGLAVKLPLLRHELPKFKKNKQAAGV